MRERTSERTSLVLPAAFQWGLGLGLGVERDWRLARMGALTEAKRVLSSFA